jgi:hypothetical protein
MVVESPGSECDTATKARMEDGQQESANTQQKQQ